MANKIKTRHNLVCKNCRRFMCETDGTALYVSNLEVLPKTKIVRRAKSRQVARDIICDGCGEPNRVFLKKPTEDEKSPEKKGKFLIFRSRFD